MTRSPIRVWRWLPICMLVLPLNINVVDAEELAVVGWATSSDGEFEEHAVEVGLENVPDGLLASRYYLVQDIVAQIVEKDVHPLEDTVSFLARNVYSLDWRFAASCLDSLVDLEYEEFRFGIDKRGTRLNIVVHRVLSRLDERAKAFVEQYNVRGARFFPSVSSVEFTDRELDPLLLLNLRLIRKRNTFGRDVDHGLGSGLRILTIQNSGLNDSDLSFLNGLHGLTLLDVGFNPLDGSGLENLVLPSLRVLRLDGCKLKSEVFTYELLHSVELLVLLQTNTADEHISLLRGSKLTELNISGTLVTPSCFELLSGLANLQSLAIDSDLFINCPLEQISKLGKLKKLRVSGDLPPDRSLDFLQGALPNVEIKMSKSR